MAATAITTGLNSMPNVFGAGAAAVLNPLATQAADASNGNSFVPNGQNILLLHNSDSGSHTFSITGVADEFGAVPATGTITILAGKIALMGPFEVASPWNQADGTVVVTCSDATILLSVLTT